MAAAGDASRWVSVDTIADLLGGRRLGDGQYVIRGIRPLLSAQSSDIAFLANPRYVAQLGQTAAGCVIVGPEQQGLAATLPSAIVCDDPYAAFARLTRWWAARFHRREPPPGIHPTAWVDPGAIVDPSASVGPFAAVAEGATIGPRAVLGAHCVVEAGAHVGADAWVAARVFLGERCILGSRTIVHAGVVIGADGFGFAPEAGRWAKIAQLGAVRVGDDVEIGANTCIDRGALDDTVIAEGVKLDNLIQIGHNVRIGAHTAMAGCVGVAGSARIGAHCTFGGGAIVLGHLEIVDTVHVSAATVVTRSILRPGHYSGVFPMDDNASWEKNAATLRQLHRLRERVRGLERALPQSRVLPGNPTP